MTTPLKTFALPLSICIALSACDGADNNASNSTPVSPPVVITSLNSQQIASNALMTSDTILLGSSGAAGRGATKSLGSETSAITLTSCRASGTVDITTDISNILTGISVGDSITTVYNNCSQNGRSVLNGELQMEFTRAVGANLLFQTQYDFGARTAFNGFSVTESNAGITLTGDISMEASFSSGNQVLNVRSDTLMSVTGQRTSTIKNWAASLDYSPATKVSRTSSSGMITDNVLNGSYEVVTLTPFESVNSDFPHTGAMAIKGDKSGLVVTALSNTLVEIGIDVNNDTVPDFTKEVPWTELHTVELPKTSF